MSAGVEGHENGVAVFTHRMGLVSLALQADSFSAEP